MIKIYINNSLSKIENINDKLHNVIKQELTYENPELAFQKNQYISKLRSLNTRLDTPGLKITNKSQLIKQRNKLKWLLKHYDKDLSIKFYKNNQFPSGLLKRVVNIINNMGYEYELIDERKKPKLHNANLTLKNQFPSFRYYQNKIIQATQNSERGAIESACGTGKTLMINKLIWKMGVNTLIITPGKDINKMLYDSFIHFFGKGKVQKVDSKTTKINKPIAIGNIQALVKLKKGVLDNIDMSLWEEAHHNSATSYQFLNENHLNNCYYRYLFTATFYRNDGFEIGLEAFTDQILYQYTFKQAIKDGYLTKPEFIWIENEAPYYEKYQTEYKKSIVENAKRNKIISDLITKHQKQSTLVLVKQLEHGKILSKLNNVEFMHGQLSDTKRQKLLKDFKEQKIKTLIATDGVCGEGIDIPCIEVLISAHGGKAQSKIVQAVGRPIRIYPEKKKALIYDFRDKGSKYLEEHASIRETIYNQFRL